MNLKQIEERLKAIAAEMETRSGAELETLQKEVAELEARKAELQDIETRQAIAKQIGAGSVSATVVEKKAEVVKSDEEVRSSVDYGKAYLKALKTGDVNEARALLSEGAYGGQIPVPTFLETEIKNAWEEHEIMSLVKKSYLKGNVRVGFEVSATGAVVHAEGTAAPEEEVITLGSVELKAQSIKKWITVSDEALEGTTVDTIGYLYKEIAYKIVEKAEEIVITSITSAQVATDATHPGVAELNANPEEDTIVTAVSLLSAKARNLYVIMNRQTWPAFVKLALKAGYAIDVFDGLKDKVKFSDKLPAFSAASVGNTYMTIGDFGYGYQANFPNGQDITIKVDDLSLAEQDLVKLVGREFVGLGIVAPKAFVNVKKVATE